MKPETEAFFIYERRNQLSRCMAWVAVRKYGELAGLALPDHPHMLRHGCGTLWPTKARIRGLVKTTLDTGIFNTPFVTLPPMRHGLKGFGGKW